MKIKDTIICSLFAALIGILAQISIPLPGGVPLTLQTLAVSLSGIILGSKRGFISNLTYILLGAFGIPVFSNFSSGLGILLGPAGGFLISFPIMAFVIGFLCERTTNKIIVFLSIILGSVLSYTIGLLQFSFVTGSTLYTSFLVAVAPFIILDLMKSILATIAGLKIKRLLF